MGMLEDMSEEERAAELIRLRIIRDISSSYDMFLITNKRIFCEGRYAWIKKFKPLKYLFIK